MKPRDVNPAVVVLVSWIYLWSVGSPVIDSSGLSITVFASGFAATYLPLRTVQTHLREER